MTYLTRLRNQIPAPIRSAWQASRPFIVLALAVIALWLTNGECLIRDYVRTMAHFKADLAKDGTLYHIGYHIGFWIAQLIKAPLRLVSWLGFAWGLGAVTHWVAFRGQTYLTNDKARSPWTVLLLTAGGLWLVGAGALTTWAGPGSINDDLANLLVGWCLGYAVWLYLRNTRRVRRQLTETATQAELTALKAQINPHFLFNSLNNIFGTALTEGGQRTPEGVQQLSGLLRYQLEKTQVERVDVATELRFLDDYVQFHRQLLPNAVVHQYEWDEQPARIAPLLLTPLVDYALQQQTARPNRPVESRLTVNDRFLRYRLTYPARPAPPTTATEALSNVRQRLNTLYPAQYSFRETGGELELTINLVY